MYVNKSGNNEGKKRHIRPETPKHAITALNSGNITSLPSLSLLQCVACLFLQASEEMWTTSEVPFLHLAKFSLSVRIIFDSLHHIKNLFKNTKLICYTKIYFVLCVLLYQHKINFFL